MDEVVPDFVDTATNGPRPGREESWGIITEYRVHLALEARQLSEAENLQCVCVNWDRQRAASALVIPPDALDDVQWNAIRTLAVSLETLGHILREEGKPDCVAVYSESLLLCQRIGCQSAEAHIALGLGRACLDLPALHDLAQAEHWYQRSLELREEHDRLGRGKCVASLGTVAYQRFEDARAANKPKEELLYRLNTAFRFFQQALDLFPPSAVVDLAVTHHRLGTIYAAVGDVDHALEHNYKSIRYNEEAGDLYGAAESRFNVAVDLANIGRLADAREYAYAALRNYETCGDRVAGIQETQRLIEKIEQLLQAQGG